VTPLLLVAALAAPPPPALGRDVVINEPTRGAVLSIAGSVRVGSEVRGDVVAVAGDVELEPGAVVSGDVVAIGGRVTGTGSVGGRRVSLSSLLGAALPVGSLAPTPRSRWGIFMLRTGGWIVLVTALLLLAPRTVRRTGSTLEGLGWRSLLAGAVALLVWIVAMVLALAVSLRALGGSMALAGVVVFLALKILGITAATWVVGRHIVAALPLALRGELPRTGIAALALVTVGLVPVLGGAVWLLANLAGLGAAVGALVSLRGRLRLARNAPSSAF
jgi:hypothetical protein